MDPRTASQIAARVHGSQTDRCGGLLVEHLARVAAYVPPDARSVAWLHDVLEHTDTSLETLRQDGLTPTEECALALLTRDTGEPYEEYLLRLKFAHGAAGRLARVVKHADLDDHLAHASIALDHAPPYAWARRHIVNAQWQNREAVEAA